MYALDMLTSHYDFLCENINDWDGEDPEVLREWEESRDDLGKAIRILAGGY